MLSRWDGSGDDSGGGRGGRGGWSGAMCSFFTLTKPELLSILSTFFFCPYLSKVSDISCNNSMRMFSSRTLNRIRWTQRAGKTTFKG